jgi:DNA-binding NarL/FixJ family response regulator
MQVIVADDETKVRSALRLLLEQELGLDVAGEAADAEQLLNQCTCFGPDLLLLDWELPGLTAGDLATLRCRCPRLHVIALSGRPDARRAALVAGVDAFVSKVGSPDVLLSTIRALIPSSSNGSRPQAKHGPNTGQNHTPDGSRPADADVAGGKR